MQPNRSPLLLVPKAREIEDTRVVLPVRDANLFERLIRDPQAPNRPARERLCAEMLRSVLVASPVLRGFVVKWMAELSGLDPNSIDELEWQLETEQPIGAKRDDLRIEGWRIGEEGDRHAVLWTVEIKVAAPFHRSSIQTWDEAPYDNAILDSNELSDPQAVNQLVNYDSWLARQGADHRAGFVLAVRDCTADLPAMLNEKWVCVTWTQLGRLIEETLASDRVPESERLLTTHFLGFINDRLWSEFDMPTPIDFDDLVLIRAFAAIGIECERKVNEIVATLVDTMRNSGLPLGDIKEQRTLYRTLRRSVCFGQLLPNNSQAVDCSLFLMVGIEEDRMHAWIESSPAKESKQRIEKAIAYVLPRLNERDPRWRKGNDRWRDLDLSDSLVGMLTADDQAAVLRNFIAKSLEDLKLAGVIDAIHQELEG